MKNPEELAREAEEQLRQFPPLDYQPTFHPYYWLGYLAAAKAMSSSDTAGARRTLRRSSNSRRRAGG